MFCSDLPPRLYESLKALCYLAQAGGPRQAHEVAGAAAMPPAQTAKILQMMAWAGFVSSRRGTKGGFWLARRAERIRVTDVADFFERRVQGRRRAGPNGVLKALEQATARCEKEFARITVADLAEAGCEARGGRVRHVASAQRGRKTRRAGLHR